MPMPCRTRALLLSSLPLLAQGQVQGSTDWAGDLEVGSGAEVVPPITEVHLIFPCGGLGTAPFPFPA